MHSWYPKFMAIKAVIFDCFGVLYPVYVDNFFNRHSQVLNGDHTLIDRLNLQIDLGQITQAEFYTQLGEALHIPGDQIKAEMEQNLTFDAQLIDFIKELSKSYKIGLLSNAGQEEIEVIHRDGLDSLFDAITVSYEVGDVKPNPKIFNTALSRLEVAPEESIFIDDSAQNLRGAGEIGIATIHYPKFGEIPEALKNLASLTSASP